MSSFTLQASQETGPKSSPSQSTPTDLDVLAEDVPIDVAIFKDVLQQEVSLLAKNA